MSTKRTLLALLLLLLVLLAACGGAETVQEAPASEETLDDTAADLGEPPSAVGSESTGGPLPAPPTEGEKVAATRVSTDSATEVVASEALAAAPVATGGLETDAGEVARAGETTVSDESAAVVDMTLDQNSRLTAGEVDDNDAWDDYLLYLREYEGAAVMRVDVSERHQIRVQDTVGNPVLGARVDVLVAGERVQTLRTHSDGRVFFFPRALSQTADEYVINVTVNDLVETLAIANNDNQREWVVTHPGAARQELPRARLDIMFLIDATGSMEDEINQLKDNIQAIAAQIYALPAEPDVRFGMVAYRDRGDEYVTRVFDFTPELEPFAQDLESVFAGGGGDYPEDLNEALFQAIHTAEWRVDNTVSLIFLVADAPPHLDYGQQNHYGVEMMEAAERGIKIFPIASSGLDNQGEYVFRQLAQTTGGRFIFLTYGESGPGSSGTETTFDVSDYTVGSLDTLVVRIVTEELSFLVQ